MSSLRIFWQRMVQDWRFQLRAFRSIADWTIWLYLIIPTIVIFLFMYRSWWLQAAPGWIEWVPLSLFFLVGSLFSWGGAFRTYTDEADKVFLIKKEGLFLNLKKWGFGYSVLYQALLSLMVVVILLPFMINHYQLTGLHAFSFFLYIVGLKYLLMYVKFQMRKIEMKTIRMIITLVLFILLGRFSFSISSLWIDGQFTILMIISVFFTTMGLFLYIPLLRKNSLFDLWIATERDEKLKMVNMIYQMSYDIEKPKVYSRKKPWLFRNSFLIFKKRTVKNGFLELFMKVFIRNSSYVLAYVQISSVTAAALIVVPPLWIKMLIFVGFLFMLSIWFEGIWERIVLSHPFTKKYKEHASYFSAKQTAKRALFSVAFLFIGLVVGIGLWIIQLSSVLFT